MDPAGASPPDPHYKLMLHVRYVSLHFFEEVYAYVWRYL